MVQVRLTGRNVQLVLQHCSGGTLEEYCKHHQVTEDLACYFFHQLVSVLEHLHTSRIAYRDMKLDNVLLSSRPAVGQPPRLVLCDLGTAKSWKKGCQPTRCETFVGTPGAQVELPSLHIRGSLQCCDPPLSFQLVDDAKCAYAS